MTLLGLSLALGLASLHAGRHQGRWIKGFEVRVPTGSYTITEFLDLLQTLNQHDERLKFPSVQDDRKITYRLGDRGDSLVVPASDFMRRVEREIKLFQRDFHWEIARDGFHMKAKGEEPKSSKGKKNTKDTWKEDLEVIEETVVAQKGETSSLDSGRYEEPLRIEGEATIEKGNLAVEELKVEGSLDIIGQKVAGEKLESEGQITINKGGEVKFKLVETRGELELNQGSTLTVDEIVLDKGGHIVLGKDSHLILN